MKVFLDTSSLYKIYEDEADSEELTNRLDKVSVSVFYLSAIASIKFVSAANKQFRVGQLSYGEADELIQSFRDDFGKFTLILTNKLILTSAKELTEKYRSEGLRTLDAIQLASALHVSDDLDLALTSDARLKEIMQMEGLKTNF